MWKRSSKRQQRGSSFRESSKDESVTPHSLSALIISSASITDHDASTQFLDAPASPPAVFAGPIARAPTAKTKSETSSDVDYANDPAADRAGGGRLPELGNVDRSNIRNFRDSYMKQNAKESLKRRGGLTINQLNVKDLQKNLVGRNAEILQLEFAFNKALQGDGPTGAFIQGPAGTGKSALAQQLQKETKNAYGFYCSGQYLDSVEPYTGFSEAMADLAQQIWNRDHAFVQDFMKQLEETIVDEDLAILLNFVPHLKKLGVSTTTVPTTTTSKINSSFNNKRFGGGGGGGAATKANQLRIVLKKFIKIICDKKIPLVLVLENVHWADPSSILLMSTLVNETGNSTFCFIATARTSTHSSEDGHLATPFFETWQAQNKSVQDISIQDLEPEEAHSFICTALRSSENNPKIEPLSKLVYERTHGNPYFILAFLQNLIDEDMLEYNLGTLSFAWNIDAIKEKGATENVGDLAALSLGKLNPDLQSLLQVASCLSHAFNSDELAFVVKGFGFLDQFQDMTWPFDIPSALEELSDRNILTSHWLPSTYSFVHQQTKSAAFTLIPYKKRNQFRLAVGQRLIKGMGNQTKQDRYLCLATDLCNSGLDLLESSHEIVEHAKWNALAGEYTIQKGAYSSALQYFETGMTCLKGGNKASNHNRDDYWYEHPKMTLTLYSGACEAAYSTGDFDKSEKYADAVLLDHQDMYTIQDCFRIYSTRVSVLEAQERFTQAVEVARHVLKELGVANLPQNPSMFMVLCEIIKTGFATRKLKTQESFMSLPHCDDPNRVNGSELINSLGISAYVANPNFFLVMFLRSMRWSVKYGVTPYSPVAIITYGLILCGLFKDAKEGMKYGEAALELAKVRNLRGQRAASISVFYAYIQHWSKPVRHSYLPLAYAHQLALEVGEVEAAFVNIANHDNMMLAYGAKPLHELVIEVEAHHAKMVEYKHDDMKSFQVVTWQFALNLVGQDPENIDPKKLNGSIMTEGRIRRLAKEKSNRLLEVFMDDWRAQLAYMFGDYDSAAEIAKTSMDYGVKVGQGTYQLPRHALFVGLIHTALAADTSKTNKAKKKHINKATAMKKRITQWLEGGNVNILHMKKLLEAELTSVKPKKNASLAEDLYKEAIMAATRAGFVHDRALCHERAALYFLETYKDETFWAVYHLKNAVQCYRDWGATKKVEQILSQYGEMIKKDNAV